MDNVTPTTAEIVKATMLAIDAAEYDADYYPDDGDGYADYSNDALGELCDLMIRWPLTYQELFVEALEGHPAHEAARKIVEGGLPA